MESGSQWDSQDSDEYIIASFTLICIERIRSEYVLHPRVISQAWQFTRVRIKARRRANARVPIRQVKILMQRISRFYGVFSLGVRALNVRCLLMVASPHTHSQPRSGIIV